MEIGVINLLVAVYGAGLALWFGLLVFAFAGIASRADWPLFRRRLLSDLPPLATAVGVLLAGWTVGIQARQTAEIALQASGDELVKIEMANDDLRCLYSWHGWDREDECLATIARSGEKYRLAMLYIEEALYLIENAIHHRRMFGSRYADDIKYWTADISADPTGLFSYQAVVENPDDPVGYLRSVRVDIEPAKICENYRKVRNALELAKAGVLKPEGAFAMSCLAETSG